MQEDHGSYTATAARITQGHNNRKAGDGMWLELSISAQNV